MAEDAARDLLREGEAANTSAAYRCALRYWAAWFAARNSQPMRLPVPVPAMVQFIVDHVERTTPTGLVSQLPTAVDRRWRTMATKAN